MSKIPLRTPDARLVTVFTTHDPVHAELIRNTLVEHDIPCETGGGHQAGFTGTLAVEIIVREADAELAKAIARAHNLFGNPQSARSRPDRTPP